MVTCLGYKFLHLLSNHVANWSSSLKGTFKPNFYLFSVVNVHQDSKALHVTNLLTAA